ncbi:uncharacterized protein LOC127708781 [Mytilus californianus]|uniref:uncharacterized protein LOC127708781 n=1 Tax=Mytilus californianus TaxID=6549 RepID=UPI0022460CB5|nr:uncharacterized protein LOC127708781 [Mytilus californianus]
MELKFLIILCYVSLQQVYGYGNNTTLSCFDCEEIFEERWDPYTDCQVYPHNTPLRPCLDIEMYCMVEKVTIYGMTTSIKRRCTSECYYGCRAHNFGLTTMKCTSCCQFAGCNIDGSASISFMLGTYTCVLTFCFLVTLLTKQ